MVPRQIDILVLVKQTFTVFCLVFYLTFGGCMPEFFPEEEPKPTSPVDPSWHAYKKIYPFAKNGVPKTMAEIIMRDGLHTTLAKPDVPTDGIDRLDEQLQRLAVKNSVTYQRIGAVAHLSISTKLMTGRAKLTGARDIVRGTNPALYAPFVELAELLNQAPN